VQECLAEEAPKKRPPENRSREGTRKRGKGGSKKKKKKRKKKKIQLARPRHTPLQGEGIGEANRGLHSTDKEQVCLLRPFLTQCEVREAQTEGGVFSAREKKTRKGRWCRLEPV